MWQFLVPKSLWQGELFKSNFKLQLDWVISIITVPVVQPKLTWPEKSIKYCIDLVWFGLLISLIIHLFKHLTNQSNHLIIVINHLIHQINKFDKPLNQIDFLLNQFNQPHNQLNCHNLV